MAGGSYGPSVPLNGGGGGVQRHQRLQRRYGLPFEPYPGFFNGPGSAQARKPVVGPTPQPPAIDPGIKCIADYLAQAICDCTVDGLLNIQQVARLPSHINPPYSSRCLDLHTGTGTVGSIDPPIILPPLAPAGPLS